MAYVERVRLYFDPRSPWCYQSLRWLRAVEAAGEVELDFGLFSLEMQNLGSEEDPLALGESARSAPALRTAWAIGQHVDTRAIGTFYDALGFATWAKDPPERDLGRAVIGAAAAAGFDKDFVDAALRDPATWVGVVNEHHALVNDKRAIGVPTLVFLSWEGQSPGIFGPVLSEGLSNEDAIELFRHLRWLVRYRNLAEVKRARKPITDLAAATLRESEQPWGPAPWVA